MKSPIDRAFAIGIPAGISLGMSLDYLLELTATRWYAKFHWGFWAFFLVFSLALSFFTINKYAPRRRK